MARVVWGVVLGGSNGESVGRHPVLVVEVPDFAVAVLDVVPDFGVHGFFPLGDDGGPRRADEGAVEGVGHEGQRVRRPGGRLGEK